LVLIPTWSPDEDGGSINDLESRRVIPKRSIGLAFWEKLFEGLPDSLQRICNITIAKQGKYTEIGSNELEG
jgi:hypothetical protein